MGVNTVSAGERMYLNLINSQAQKVLSANMSAAVETLSDTRITESGYANRESRNATSAHVAVSQYSISPVDKNCDGEVSREEFQSSLNNARQLLAALHNTSSMMRAFHAQNAETEMSVDTENMAVSA